MRVVDIPLCCDDGDEIPLYSAADCVKCGGTTFVLEVNSRHLFSNMNPDIMDGCRIRLREVCYDCGHEQIRRVGFIATRPKRLKADVVGLADAEYQQRHEAHLRSVYGMLKLKFGSEEDRS